MRRGLRLFHQLRDTPDMIGEAEFHRWRHPQRFVDTIPIVEGDMQRNGGTMGADFLGVSTRPPRTPAEVHPHGQVGPLDMVGGSFAEIGIAPHTRVLSPILVELHIIHIPAKCLSNGLLIRYIGVRDDLGPVQHPPSEVRHKALGILSGPLADAVTDDRLAVAVQREPQVTVAVLGGAIVLKILLLHVDE